MVEREQSDLLPGQVPSDGTPEDSWRVVCRFEDGYALGYTEGFSAGATTSAVITATILLILWAVLR